VVKIDLEPKKAGTGPSRSPENRPKKMEEVRQEYKAAKQKGENPYAPPPTALPPKIQSERAKKIEEVRQKEREFTAKKKAEREARDAKYKEARDVPFLPFCRYSVLPPSTKTHHLIRISFESFRKREWMRS